MAKRNDAVRLPIIGLVFLLVLSGLVAASIADYRGAFTPSTKVTLVVPDAGNQLTTGAQVKLRGAVVGTVDRIDPVPEGAELTLALDPDRTHLIPTNTVARVLPKTLIGQDYVDLVLPADPSRDRVSEGDVIARDTSAATATLEGALDKLLAVLEVIPPQQVASTLNAVSTALEGRGEELGQTLTRLQRYLNDFNPALPDLVTDLRQLVGFSDTYSDAAPDLLAAFDDLSTTARTVVEQRDQLREVLSSVEQVSNDAADFFDANGDNMINLVDVSRPTLQTLATYAPQYPCLLRQLAGLVPRVNEIFGQGDARPALNITLKVTNSRGKYRPGEDEPAYLDTRGPRCYKIMRFAPQYPAEGPIQDGSTFPPAVRRADASAAVPPLPLGPLPNDLNLPGSQAENNLINGLLGADGLGAPFAPLLLGPLLRGSEVQAR